MINTQNAYVSLLMSIFCFFVFLCTYFSLFLKFRLPRDVTPRLCNYVSQHFRFVFVITFSFVSQFFIRFLRFKQYYIFEDITVASILVIGNARGEHPYKTMGEFERARCTRSLDCFIIYYSTSYYHFTILLLLLYNILLFYFDGEFDRSLTVFILYFSFNLYSLEATVYQRRNAYLTK